MYKAVFLDIGGVILQIDWKKPFEFAGIFDERIQADLIERFHGNEIFHRFERGEITAKEFLNGFNTLIGTNHPNEFWEKAWQSLIIGPLPEVDRLFDLLEGRWPVYGLSNTNVLHYQYMMAAFPVMKRFKRVVASNVLGERKPDAAFYLKACAELGYGPSEVLFVDDTFENVEAAKRVGIKAQQTVNSARGTIEFLRSQLNLPDVEF